MALVNREKEDTETKTQDEKLRFMNSLYVSSKENIVDCNPEDKSVMYKYENGNITKRTPCEIWTRVMGR